MKIKEPTFLELLESFFTEHMPLTAGLSDNTVRLYKATFRLLMRFLYELDSGKKVLSKVSWSRPREKNAALPGGGLWRGANHCRSVRT